MLSPAAQQVRGSSRAAPALLQVDCLGSQTHLGTASEAVTVAVAVAVGKLSIPVPAPRLVGNSQGEGGAVYLVQGL